MLGTCRLKIIFPEHQSVSCLYIVYNQLKRQSQFHHCISVYLTNLKVFLFETFDRLSHSNVVISFSVSIKEIGTIFFNNNTNITATRENKVLSSWSVVTLDYPPMTINPQTKAPHLAYLFLNPLAVRPITSILMYIV